MSSLQDQKATNEQSEGNLSHTDIDKQDYYQMPAKHMSRAEIAKEIGLICFGMALMDIIIYSCCGIYVLLSMNRLEDFYSDTSRVAQNASMWIMVIAGVLWILRVLAGMNALANPVALWALREEERTQFIRLYFGRILSLQGPQYVAAAAFVLMVILALVG